MLYLYKKLNAEYLNREYFDFNKIMNVAYRKDKLTYESFKYV